MRIVLIMLAFLAPCLFSAQSQASPPAYIRVDTLTIDIPLGQHGQAYNIDSLAANQHLQMLIGIVNADSSLMLGVQTNANHIRWIPAKGNKNVSGAFDGAVVGRRSMFVTEVIRLAGLNDLHNDLDIIELPVRTRLPFIKLYLTKKDCGCPTCPPAREAKKDTLVIYHKTRSFARRCFSDLELGAGLSTSPYNGVATLNLEARFNRRTYLEASFGHSADLFSKDRAVPGLGERLTDDRLFALRFIRYFPNSHAGLHLGGMRLENVIRDGPYGQQHIRCYQALLIGPSFRFGKLTAHLSFAYGSDDQAGKDIKWTPRCIGEINLFPWR